MWYFGEKFRPVGRRGRETGKSGLPGAAGLRCRAAQPHTDPRARAGEKRGIVCEIRKESVTARRGRFAAPGGKSADGRRAGRGCDAGRRVSAFVPQHGIGEKPRTNKKSPRRGAGRQKQDYSSSAGASEAAGAGSSGRTTSRTAAAMASADRP